MRALVFGCGYLGRRVAAKWINRGHQVFAVTRREAACAELSDLGATPVVADVTDAATLVDLPVCDVVLFAVGFDRAANKSIEEVYAGGAKLVAEAVSPETSKFIYISSTGVYGPGDGGRVDESTPCRPTRAGGRACLAAEQALANSPLADRTIVLRLAGIYGPDRLPRLQSLKRGDPQPVAPEALLNLIHVDDAADVVVAVADQIDPPEMFVVSDGTPVRRRDYLGLLAQLVSAPPPNFSDEPTEETRGGDKYVVNEKLVWRLNLDLQFPSYRTGLPHALASSEHRTD